MKNMEYKSLRSIRQLVKEYSMDVIKEQHEQIPSLIQVIDYDNALLQNLPLMKENLSGIDKNYVIYRPQRLVSKDDAKNKEKAKKYIYPYIKKIEKFPIEFYDTKETIDIKKKYFSSSRTNSLLIYPNLDITLSKAKPSPTHFILNFYHSNWYCQSSCLGSIAISMAKFIHDLKMNCSSFVPMNTRAASWLKLSLVQKGLLTFSFLLDLLSRSEDDEQSNKLWMGCPTTPDLLLSVCQWRYHNVIDRTWKIPKPSPVVTLMNDISKVNEKVMDVMEDLECFKTHDNKIDDQNGKEEENMLENEIKKAEDIIRGVEQLKGKISTQHEQYNWESLCEYADTLDLDNYLISIREQVNEYKAYNENNKNLSSSSTISSVASLLQSHLSLQRDRLDFLIFQAKGSTANITMIDANLLFESAGKDLKYLPPGGCDFSVLNRNLLVENYIKEVQMTVCGFSGTSVRRIPLVALLKLVTLRMTESDNWKLEYFGFIAWRDSSIMSSSSSALSTSSIKEEEDSADHKHDQRQRKIELKEEQENAENENEQTQFPTSEPRNDLWSEIVNLHDFYYAVHGLCLCIDKLLHPSILKSSDIRKLFNQLEEMYVFKNGLVLNQDMVSFFNRCLSHHVQSLRGYASGWISKFPDICSWQTSKDQKDKHIKQQFDQLQISSCVRRHEAMIIDKRNNKSNNNSSISSSTKTRSRFGPLIKSNEHSLLGSRIITRSRRGMNANGEWCNIPQQGQLRLVDVNENINVNNNDGVNVNLKLDNSFCRKRSRDFNDFTENDNNQVSNANFNRREKEQHYSHNYSRFESSPKRKRKNDRHADVNNRSFDRSRDSWRGVCIKCCYRGHYARDCNWKFGPVLTLWPSGMREKAIRWRRNKHAKIVFRRGVCLGNSPPDSMLENFP